MAITPGADIDSADFITTSAGAGDSGKVAKLDAAGKIDPSFITTGFGGTGADGALSISSGTTTIDLAGAAILVKNYTSISITGTGKLAFTNPHANGSIVILKSQGNVTLSSSQTPMIDISNLGAAAGAAVSAGASSTANGNSGTPGHGLYFLNDQGDAGNNAASPSAPGGTAAVFNMRGSLIDAVTFKYGHLLVPGSGGGSGAIENATGSSSTSGAGSRGAGALGIECNGTFTFTTAGGLSTKPANGGDTSGVSGSNVHAGGGGAGGGGVAIALYKKAGTITGTITTTAATGGSGTDTGSSLANGTSPCSGGGGSSLVANGSDGNAQGVSNMNGGNGAAGYGLMQQV